MLLYFTIGILVETWTMIMRLFIRKIPIDFEGWTVWTCIGFLVGLSLNIIFWPITIVAEIVNIIKGV